MEIKVKARMKHVKITLEDAEAMVDITKFNVKCMSNAIRQYEMMRDGLNSKKDHDAIAEYDKHIKGIKRKIAIEEAELPKIEKAIHFATHKQIA
jgi:hypothetical protein